MRADYYTVSCFQSEKRLENSGRSRVGSRYYSRYNSDRLCYLHHSAGLVFFDNSAGLCVLIGVVYILGSKVVLDNLVFNNTHAGFLNRHFSKRYTLFVGCYRRRLEYLVYLLLRVLSKFVLRRSDACDRFLERFNTVYNRVNVFLHVFSSRLALFI